MTLYLSVVVEPAFYHGVIFHLSLAVVGSFPSLPDLRMLRSVVLFRPAPGLWNPGILRAMVEEGTLVLSTEREGPIVLSSDNT